jgi:hypothetical protein
MMNAHEFLSHIWGADAEGRFAGTHYICGSRPNWVQYPAATLSEALAHIQRLRDQQSDVYFACAEFETGGSRKASEARGARGLWQDIDCGEAKAAAGQGYRTKVEAQLALDRFCSDAILPRPNIVVDSGNGLHCYWTFDEVVPVERWKVLAEALKDRASLLGFRADGVCTADIARIMRMPDTCNWKDRASPKPVNVLRNDVPVELASLQEVLAPSEDVWGCNLGGSVPRGPYSA